MFISSKQTPPSNYTSTIQQDRNTEQRGLDDVTSYVATKKLLNLYDGVSWKGVHTSSQVCDPHTQHRQMRALPSEIL